MGRIPGRVILHPHEGFALRSAASYGKNLSSSPLILSFSQQARLGVLALKSDRACLQARWGEGTPNKVRERATPFPLPVYEPFSRIRYNSLACPLWLSVCMEIGRSFHSWSIFNECGVTVIASEAKQSRTKSLILLWIDTAATPRLAMIAGGAIGEIATCR